MPISGFVFRILLEGVKNKKGIRLIIDEFVLTIPTEELKKKLAAYRGSRKNPDNNNYKKTGAAMRPTTTQSGQI